ncbi:FAD-dependent monooxygenase [Pandoraea cepalis]|nr:FAD-dependent monooxygenase [Pandoraea cepalis]
MKSGNQSQHSTPSATRVIVAGAGPVGLSLALDLGRRGIACVLVGAVTVEQGLDRDRVRKANAINNRSMEYMRRLGVADQIRDAARRVERSTLDVAFVTSLSGYEIARFVDAFESSPDQPEPDLSPEKYLRINQEDIQDILRDALRECPSVRVLSGMRVAGFTDTGDVVRVHIETFDGTDAGEIEGQYLLGCDGGSSTVRKVAGIRFEGEGSRVRNLNISFHSDEVESRNVHAPASMYWVVNPLVNGYIGSDKGHGRMTLWDIDEAQEQSIRQDPGKVISAAVGVPVSVEAKSFDCWYAHRLVASTYRRGRVFLAGDAAHLHPPTGGLGMNTGLGDASNLGWKLAAVIEGWGAPALLDTYDIERRPIGARVVAQANLQFDLPPAAFLLPHLDAPTDAGNAARAVARERIMNEKRTEFFSRGLVLGQSYANSPATIAARGSLNSDVVQYQPTAEPGARLPHVRLNGSSLYDKLDRHGLTLIDCGGSAAEILTMASTAKQLGIPLTVLSIPEKQRAQYERRYLLVRPDHHVATWSDVPLPEATMRQAVGFDIH